MFFHVYQLQDFIRYDKLVNPLVSLSRFRLRKYFSIPSAPLPPTLLLTGVGALLRLPLPSPQAPATYKHMQNRIQSHA